MLVSMVLPLLGGLGLFLFGMQMMSSNLEAVAGSKMKRLIEKLTSNRFLGVAVGAGITAAIQSSSATTVMVVGFINSQLMTLQQAVWIIMGANIGTTVTGLLISLNIGTIAPLIAFVGIVMLTFLKNKTVKNIGSIIAGLGILFIGMGIMSEAMEPLRDNQGFINIMTSFSNPLLGILAGALFTALIQSSSASVGILQTLAATGVIGLDSAVYVLFGQNIGTCITAVIASIGANRNAKRATVIHLLFNIIGTTVFTVICVLFPFTRFVESIIPDPVAQIAGVHTLFNVTTTLLLLPFGKHLARLSEKILPDKKSSRRTVADKWFEDVTTNSRHILGSSAVALQSLRDDVLKMLYLTVENVTMGFDAVITGNTDDVEKINRNEEKVDRFNFEISQKIAKLLTVEQSPVDIKEINRLFSTISDIERISDHSVNFGDYAVMLSRQGLRLSKETCQAFTEMRDQCKHALLQLENFKDVKLLEKIRRYEELNDSTVRAERKRQINVESKLEDGAERIVICSELLADYERIGDHMLNIAEALTDSQEIPPEVTDKTGVVQSA